MFTRQLKVVCEQGFLARMWLRFGGGWKSVEDGGTEEEGVRGGGYTHEGVWWLRLQLAL